MKTAPQQPLTETQQATYDWLMSRLATKGVMPTIQDTADQFGISYGAAAERRRTIHRKKHIKKDVLKGWGNADTKLRKMRRLIKQNRERIERLEYAVLNLERGAR